MTLLSEATIRAYLRHGELIEDCSEDCVCGATYSCRAAKVIPGGLNDERHAV
jgi:hypothetical protein